MLFVFSVEVIDRVATVPLQLLLTRLQHILHTLELPLQIASNVRFYKILASGTAQVLFGHEIAILAVLVEDLVDLEQSRTEDPPAVLPMLPIDFSLILAFDLGKGDGQLIVLRLVEHFAVDLFGQVGSGDLIHVRL